MSVSTFFTNGVGNNLFQYFYGKILSEKINTSHYHPSLPVINIKSNTSIINNYYNHFFAEKIKSNYYEFLLKANKKNYFVRGYPEDYRIYLNHKKSLTDYIQNKIINIKFFDGIVFHLRMGDRLFQKSDYLPGMKLDLLRLEKLLNQIGKHKILIVSDLNIWRKITKEDLPSISSHVDINKLVRADEEDIVTHYNQIYNYFNSKGAIFSKLNDIRSDFSQMINCKYLIFQHGTLAWWAGFVGRQKEVFVCDGWRPAKGSKNKNLDKVPIHNWKKW
jgi:hypothetical protein